MMAHTIMERAMPDTEWEAKAKRLLRSEMTKRGVTYAELVERLAAVGVNDDERNLRNKVARGKFSAAFMLQCLAALGCKRVELDAY